MTKDDSNSPDQLRRTLLKTIAAAGAIGGGVAASTGSAAAQQGRGFKRLSFDVERSGTITETTDVVNNDKFEVGDEVTFDGELILTELDVQTNEDGDNELVASGRLKGTLSSNPTQQINQTFETVLGLLQNVLDILSPENTGECPILELVIGPIFLDLLGLQVETNQIEIDITAVAGEGNLLGNLLCAVASLLDST